MEVLGIFAKYLQPFLFYILFVISKNLNNEINTFKYICGNEENHDDYHDSALANVYLIRALKYFYLGENSKSIELLNRGLKSISV